MSDLNYGLGFYLIEVAENHYDLYNSVTDKKILFSQPKGEIINFLELNLPTHPFLYQIDQESNLACSADEYYRYLSEENISKYSFPKYENKNTFSTFTTPQFNYGNHSDTLDYDFEYNPFNYDNVDDYFVVGEDDEEKGFPYNTQLEFNFTYKDNKTIPSKNSPDIEDEELPYLPDDTDE